MKPSSDADLVVGMVIETTPGNAPDVARRLLLKPDLQLVGGDGDHRIAVVWATADPTSVEAEMQALLEEDGDILGIFPTFAGVVDENGDVIEDESAFRSFEV